jgi:acetolactate synthase I/II/III large subunit
MVEAMTYAADLAVPDAIVQALTEGGVRFVLGMPGGLTGSIWRALYQHPQIRAVQCREESIASYMAEAYGRVSAGELVVVMGQGEWIVGNAGQGYLEALLGASPMLILTEMSDAGDYAHHAPYQCGTGDYGTWDVRGALEGVTKRVLMSRNAVQAVQHTQLAIKHATTGEPGPVAVVYASVALDASLTPQHARRLFATDRYLNDRSGAVDQQQLAAALLLLASAERPVILAGNGVRLAGAREQLAELARALGAPVATTSGGKGVFDESSPLAVGPVGRYGWPSANAVVRDADVVLAVATKLGPGDTARVLDAGRQRLIQIDVEPLNLAWTQPVDVQIVGDAKVQLHALAAALTTNGGSAPPASDRVAAALARNREPALPPTARDAVPIDPRLTIQALDGALPDDVVMTCDAGENRLFMMRWFHARLRGDYLQPAGGGGMGYAIPAAMGAKLAAPDRTVVAVCGDGGFAMTMHALMTAIQENLPIGVVVLNNEALGWVLHGMGAEAVAASFAAFDHAAIARAIGCDGIRVTTVQELGDAIKRLDGLTTPLVIDVPTSLALSFKDMEQDL